MKIVIAPDSFKSSVTASAAAQSIAEGWRRGRAEDIQILRPMADGGEGTIAALETAYPEARRMPVTAVGPDDRRRSTDWLLLPPTPDAPSGTGIVELASTSGIETLSGALRPWTAHTRGLGEAIADALDHGVSKLVIGIGSSCSTDAGLGVLCALGARFFTAAGDPAQPGAAGLASIARADLSALRSVPPLGATVLADVDTPLFGPSGAAAVFGPQKGFRPDEISAVDNALRHVATLLGGAPQSAGAGAAGGTGFGLAAWGAQLVPGAVYVAELLGLREAIATAAFVITGEGSFDSQSMRGKVAGHILDLASISGTPVGLIAGRIADDADTTKFALHAALDRVAGSSEQAMEAAPQWLAIAAELLATQFRPSRTAAQRPDDRTVRPFADPTAPKPFGIGEVR